MTSIRATHDGFEVVRLSTPQEAPRFALRAVCHICNKHYLMPTKSVAQAGVTEFVGRRFREKGWTIGKNRSRDLCPDCAKSQLRIVQPPAQGELLLEPPKEATMLDNVTAPQSEKPKPAGKRGGKHATTAEILQIHAKLREVLVQRSDGNWSYQKSWSDERVAQSVNPAFSAAHAARVRHDVFGSLYKAPAVRHAKGISARVDELERLYLELADRMSTDVANHRHLPNGNIVLENVKAT